MTMTILESLSNEVVAKSNPTEADDGFSDSGISTTTSDDDLHTVSDERDEVKEVQKMASKDTRSVNTSRLAATFALLVTAVAITSATYHFLKAEEKYNFETAFDQFSTTVADAAIGQQIDIKEAFVQFSTFITAWANSDKNNQTLPFVTLPNAAAIMQNIRKQGKFETLSFLPYVTHDKRDAWVEYSKNNYEQWVKEGHMYTYGNLDRLRQVKYHPFIGEYDRNRNVIVAPEREWYGISWLYDPPPSSYFLINGNPLCIPRSAAKIYAMIELQDEIVFDSVHKHTGIPMAFSREEHAAYHSKLADSSAESPHSFPLYPVYRKIGDPTSGIAGHVSAAMAWDVALLHLLPDGVQGIHVVLRNTCNQTYTYNLVGGDAFFLGEGDHHEPKYNQYEVPVSLSLHSRPNFEEVPGHCLYSIHIFPSDSFKASFDSNTPEIFAAIVASTFVLVAIAFFVYDLMQAKRNTNLVNKAAQSNAIVTSLFPDMMRDRLFLQAEQKQAAKSKKGNLSSFLNDGKQDGAGEAAGLQSKPLADLFLSTTVLMADISGFTAWSTVREPHQVFTLLETIYSRFDEIAKRRRICKVETVGDCYVAVCGLPEPRRDHAIAMARYARDILSNMYRTAKELEVTLGPDTAELGLRIGMHSGPVTAGVLRGERARFQLFGDTMNQVSRIETLGQRGRIHCSKETAEFLKEGGKESWLEMREDVVHAKGLGALTTYWVTVKGDRGAESVGSRQTIEAAEVIGSYGTPHPGLDEKANRLIDWNVEMLLRILKQIVARRTKSRKLSDGYTSQLPSPHIGKTPLAEVREIIHLPEYRAHSSQQEVDPETVVIPTEVISQLHHLVSMIASLYHDNPFHSFQHASHVVMSVTKLLSRIVAPSQGDDLRASKRMMHDTTYGITSDPLTQWACAFSALIHDADHQGVSNLQLVKEGVPIASKYGERSVAEQNSLDLSWELLMRKDYDQLRACLFEKEADLVRFRELVVNSVMATDITDKELKALRNGRWEKAFKQGSSMLMDNSRHSSSSGSTAIESPRDSMNRKATIVIEHIIQASDISHTMQHWHVYRKWNQNLYEELYVAYLNGRMEKNPEEFWYKGEFGFFDFYIIPLTQKLKDCGVFGISSDELLHHAKKNRDEWEAHGEEAVAEMIQEARRKYGVKKDAVPGFEDEPVPGIDC